MVDIGGKEDVPRRAMARGELKLKRSTVNAIKTKKIKKGDVVSTAKVAGIQAVKDTSRVLPLCHQVPLTLVEIELEPRGDRVSCTCEVATEYKTGVEMEALVGVAAALLTVWDMVKYLEKDDLGQYPNTRIERIAVLEKRKGERGKEGGKTWKTRRI